MTHTKDYIVVKDFETAIVLRKKAIPSLKGKWIICAPHGLKFISKEDIIRLPQVKSLIKLAKEKEQKRIQKIIQSKKINKMAIDLIQAYGEDEYGHSQATAEYILDQIYKDIRKDNKKLFKNT